jgi:predicted nucleic acid-binding protein
MRLIKSIYFDSDCISSFLWVKEEMLLHDLYQGRIVIPEPVYNEISKVAHLRTRVDLMKASNYLTIKTILFGSKEFDLYNSLINPIDQKNMVIGKGEAACIALSNIENGILASNNLSDIMCYVNEFKLEHILLEIF